MPGLRMRVAVGILLVAALPAFVSGATATRSFHREVPFSAGGSLELSNVNGSVEISSWDSQLVRIDAEILVKAGRQKDAERFLDEVEIVVEGSGRRLRVEPDYPDNRGSGLLDWIFGHRRPEVRVDFRLRVPRKVDLDVENVNGRVDVSDVQGDATIRVTNGAVDVRDLAGSLSAHTVNGSVKARLLEVPPDAEIELKTVNGSIRLYLPEDVSAEVEASTVNGGIDSDFPLDVEGKYGPKHASGELGTGQASIRLKTVNGGIDIRKR